MTRTHPIQPLMWDGSVIRFRQNAIVRFLVDWCAGQNEAAGYPKLSTPTGKAPDLNELAFMKFSRADRTQLAQLIGYSVSGSTGLSYFDARQGGKADRLAQRMYSARQRAKRARKGSKRSSTKARSKSV